MQIIINIKKIHFYIFIGLISVFSLLLIVNGAYVGHTWSEVTGTPVLSSLKVTGNIEVVGNITVNNIGANNLEVNDINASGNVKTDGTLISNKLTTETLLKVGNDIGDTGSIRWQGTNLQINNGSTWLDINSSGTTESPFLVNGAHNIHECLSLGGTPRYTEDPDGTFCEFEMSTLDDCTDIDDGSWTDFKNWYGYRDSWGAFHSDYSSVTGHPDMTACDSVVFVNLPSIPFYEIRCKGTSTMINLPNRYCQANDGASYCIINKRGCI